MKNTKLHYGFWDKMSIIELHANLVTRLNDFYPVELVKNLIDVSVLSNDVISPEYQEGVPIVKVKGSLERNIAFWEPKGASRFMMV